MQQLNQGLGNAVARLQQPAKAQVSAPARMQRHPDVEIQAGGPRRYTDALRVILKKHDTGCGKAKSFMYICQRILTFKIIPL